MDQEVNSNVEQQSAEPAPEEQTAAAETETQQEASEEKKDAGKKGAKALPPPKFTTKGKVTAFIFFAITAVAFAFYMFFFITVFCAPLANSPENIFEALAEIFVYIYGLIFTFICVVLQLPENISCVILFNRMRHRSEKKGDKTVGTVFFALSMIMLLFTLITVNVFFGMIALQALKS